METFNITDNSTLSTESGSDGSEFDEYCSSQSDHSLYSESNCFSYHTEEPSNPYSVAKSKKSVNLLQKLYFREIRGNFSSHPRAPNPRLLNSVPVENRICLRQVLPESAFHTNHVFLGLSKCGQFLLSYTHSIELDVIIFNNVHKYRLHWWSFVPHQRARKVAEVMLFGNQGVYCDLHISVCQWPIDTTKLLIYGYCVHTDHCQFGHSHLTITTVPSLNKCRDCLKVAASYEEEDLAAIWDSCVRFSCLKHGLTIHSNFDVVSPYPKFNPQISMKRDGVVFFNTGNFLHVLRADLENFGSGATARPSGATPETPAPFKNLGTESDLRVENPVNFLGEFLENCNSHPSLVEVPSLAEVPQRSKDIATRIDKLKQEIEEGKIEGQKLSAELGHDSRQLWSTIEEMKNSRVDASSSDSQDAFQRLKNGKSVPNACDNNKTNSFEEVEFAACESGEKPSQKRERAVREFQNEVFLGRRRVVLKSKLPESREDAAEVEGGDKNVVKRVKTEGEDEEEGGKEVSLAEDVYVMSSMFDASMELNITCSSVEEPSRVSLKSNRALLMVSTDTKKEEAQKKVRKRIPGAISPPETAETVYEFTDDQPDNSEKLSSFRRRRLAEKKYEFCEEGEDAENIVPFRLLRAPRLRSPPVYLTGAPHPRKRPHEDPGDALTSPRSPAVSAEVAVGADQDKAVLRPLNRNLVAITLLSPREAERDWTKPGLKKVPLIEATGDGCVPEVAAHQKEAPPPGHARTKCTVQFKRRYIEVDDELVSTTTDIEDDDWTGSAPYHFALPLEIHGAGYVQLQMISNSKADKLMGAPGVVVHQMSFDVEAFCHEMAQRLCEAAGKKYCFCEDYDAEIIDVCIITGDVLVLAIMRIEAMIVAKGVAKSLRRGEIQVSGERNQYQGGCTFVWNTDTGAHRIVATSPLCESFAMDDTQEPWGPAKSHVKALRKTLPQVPMCHSVRSISNRPVFAEESYKCLSDLDNLIDLLL